MTTEIEIALALPAHLTVEQAQTWFSTQAHWHYQRTTMLTNIYYDTPNQSLKQQKAALRLRHDADQDMWIQTLKTAGTMVDGIATRREWENQVTGQQFDFAQFHADAQAYLAEIKNDLQPAFETNFARDLYVYEQDGQHYECAFDHGLVTSATSEHTIPIHEIEIEIKADTRSDEAAIAATAHLKAFAERIAHSLNTQPQLLSKAARGYALLVD